MLKLSRWRVVRIVLLVLALLALVRVVLITGLLRPVRVQSGSMAPYLLGPHTTCTCPECGYELTWGHDNPPQAAPPVCPNCGYTGRMRNVAEWEGERVLIDRGPYVWRSPQRWDIVAVRGPPGAEPLIAKRVVALPGEAFAIEHGELFINGQLLRKPLARLRELAVPVYDDACRLSQNDEQGRPFPPRWRPAAEKSDWRSTDEGYTFLPQGEKPPQADHTDWLVYHHWLCSGLPNPRAQEGAVVDLDPYNQGLSRGLNELGDLLVRFRLAPEPGAVVRVHLHEGTVTLPVIFDFEYLTVRAAADNAGLLQEVALPQNMVGREALVEVAACDGQVLVAVDGRQLLAANYERSADRTQSSTPVEIGAEKAGVQLTHLELWRDVYYVCPDGTGRNWTRLGSLGADEYFLLGDNSPASEDSRNWPDGGGLPRAAILGAVRKW